MVKVVASLWSATTQDCDFDTPSGDWCNEEAHWKVCLATSAGRPGKWSFACEHHARSVGVDTTRR